jgi:hypothetical protein
VTDLPHRLALLSPAVLELLRHRGDIVGEAVRSAIGEALELTEPTAERKPSHDQRQEAEIRMEIRRWCLHRGACLVVDSEQNRPTRVTEGLSDLIVFWGDSRGIWWVEVKTAKGKQSMAQIKFQVAVEASGGVYVLARGVGDMEARL